MKIEQIYTGCLAQGAYLISSNGEAAIIDPLRETAPYLERLKNEGLQLKYIFETHFHADFVSGHIDLHKATGAPIVYGPSATPAFEALIGTDGQNFPLGDTNIQLIHTPGHTLESSCFLLSDHTGKKIALFSGDTLFLGDVGRPDLAQKAASMTQEELAGMLYDSLYQKILPLPDDITVYPAHGAGSACGKNMMKETVDSLGNQKKMNYALNQESKAAFVKAVTDNLLPPPGYFGMNVAMNKSGYKSFDEVVEQSLKALSVAAFEQLAESSNALILDTRPNAEFSNGFIPQSINIGLKGDFAPWVGAMIVDVQQPILLVCTPGQELEAITRLSRVGFDHVLGYLDNGFDAWSTANKEVDKVHRINVATFAQQHHGAKIIDIRKESEYQNQHIQNAQNLPLAAINDWINTLNPNEHFFMHCQGGYRSMIAASILQARGIRNFSEIEGGFAAISKNETFALSALSSCQS